MVNYNSGGSPTDHTLWRRMGNIAQGYFNETIIPGHHYHMVGDLDYFGHASDFVWYTKLRLVRAWTRRFQYLLGDYFSKNKFSY